MLPSVGDKYPQISLSWGVVLSQSTFHLVFTCFDSNETVYVAQLWRILASGRWPNTQDIILPRYQSLYGKSILQRMVPLPSNRQHLSCGAYLEDKRVDNQNCSVLCCVRQLCTMLRRHMRAVLTFLHVS